MNSTALLLAGVMAALIALVAILVFLVAFFGIKARQRPVALQNPTDEFSTSVSAAECLDRIRSLTHPERSLAETTLVAKIEGSRFLLRKFGTYGFHPGMIRAFHGEVVATGNGTKIRGAFRMHPYTRVFFTCWFGFSIVVGGPLFVASVAELLGVHFATFQGNPWMGAIGLFVLLGIGYAAFWLGRI